MKDGWKVAGIVGLLSLLTVDFGAHEMIISGCLRDLPENEKHSSAAAPNGEAAPSPPNIFGLERYLKTNNWCREAIQYQQQSDGWAWSILSGAKPTDWLLVLFSGLLVYVGYRQVITYEGQRSLMARQADISEQIRTSPYWPQIIVHSVDFEIWTIGVPRAKQDARPVATFNMRSIGEKVSVLKATRSELVFAPSLPALPDSMSWRTTHVPIAEDQRWDEQIRYTEAISDTLSDEIRGHKAGKRDWRWFGFFGLIVEDAFGQQHEFGFCFWGSRGGSPGLPAGGAKHNYRRIREPEERI